MIGARPVALLVCLATVASVARGGVLEDIATRGVLRVGTPGDYRPYTDHDVASGAWRGTDIELARSLAAYLAVSVEFVPTTWGHLAEDAASGRFDIAVGGISITPERQERAFFSTALISDGKTALASCSRLQSFDTLRELNQPTARVIVNPGGTNEAFARRRLPRANLTVHRDNLTVFDELVTGRADAMITDAVEARLQSALHAGVLCAAHPDKPFDHADKAMLLPREAAFKQAVDAWLKPLIRDGRVRATQQRWLAYPWTSATGLGGLIDARLAVMSDVARYKWNTGGSIEDPARERDLLATLTQQGLARGVPAERTEAFFTAQFAAARRLQHDLFDLWRAQKRDKLPPAPDLQKQIRPALDLISARMVEALAGNDLRVQASSARDAAVSEGLLSAEAVKLALAPLDAMR